MYQRFLLWTTALVILAGCGQEPAPAPNSLEALRDKMRASHQQRFERDGSSLEEIHDENIKRADDPDAYVYDDKVLTVDEEKVWRDAGIDNTEYPGWAALGMEPKEVLEWKGLNLSYAAISVFKTQAFTPQSAQRFISRKFFTRPLFYAQFGTPVYEFDSICKAVVARQQAPFAYLEERCLPYMEASHKNEAIGHLLDEAKITKGPLALEYLAELRRLAQDNAKIQSGMEVSIEEFMEDEDTQNFIFLFPLLKSEPTKAEMDFIDENKLPLQDEERFFSYQNPQYWINKAEAEAAAAEAAARQEAVLRAKKEKERKAAEIALMKAEAMAKEKARKEALYKEQQQAKKMENIRRIKAVQMCGKFIQPDQLSGQEVTLEGEVVFTVDEAGSKMFGYGVKAAHDGQIYFVRDPRNLGAATIGQSVMWQLKTMGRTEALAQQSKQAFVYDKKSDTKFTMGLFLQQCNVQ